MNVFQLKLTDFNNIIMDLENEFLKIKVSILWGNIQMVPYRVNISSEGSFVSINYYVINVMLPF